MFEFLKQIPCAYADPANGQDIQRPTSNGYEQPAAPGVAMSAKSSWQLSPGRLWPNASERVLKRHTKISGDGKHPFPRVCQRSGRWAASALAALVTSMAMLASGTAFAVVMEPPLLPQDITVFPERDFTSISGFAPNADLLVEVVRPNAPIITAEGRTDATGFLEVNHPGGVCWIGTTPDIAPADMVRVTYRDTSNNQSLMPAPTAGWGSATTTQNVTATQAVVVQQGTAPNITYTVVVKGQAQLAGTRIPLDRLEVRIINPEFIGGLRSRITRRDIRADSTGGRVAGPPEATGTLAYDPPTIGNSQPLTFTAVFTGLNADESLLAVEGQTRVMGWQQTTTAGDRLGMTIYEVGESGGPGLGGCPAGPNGVVAPKSPTPPVYYVPGDLRDAAITANQGFLNDVTVFPQRDFISIAGFPEYTELQVVVRRGNSNAPVVVGTARGTVGRNKVFEVNHPGGVCWTGQTPDIIPGDWIDVFTVVNDRFSFGQTQRVIDTVIKKPAYINNGLVKVEGVSLTAPDANGKQSAFPLRLTEQRIINPDFKENLVGRRDIRADINGGRVGNLPGVTGYLYLLGGGKWEAIYRGLTPAQQQLAVAGQNRAMAWHSTNGNGDRFGMTISEFGELGGPGMGGCPATGSASIAITR